MDAAGYSLIAVYFAIVALARGALDARSARPQRAPGRGSGA